MRLANCFPFESDNLIFQCVYAMFGSIEGLSTNYIGTLGIGLVVAQRTCCIHYNELIYYCFDVIFVVLID